MSYPFEHGDETLWDAGYHGGQLYAALVRAAAGVLGVPSGLTPTPDGGCAVDGDEFQVFVQRLYEFCGSGAGDVLRELGHGLLATSLVLLERTGRRISVRPDHTAALDDARARLARTMTP